MSSKLEAAMWTCDTGQRVPCFDSCRLTMKWISNMTVNQGERASYDRSFGQQASNGRHVVQFRAYAHDMRPQANTANQNYHEQKT